MTTHCDLCGFEHTPASESAFVEFRGRRYRAPFRCFCCAITICVRQFASSRTCGGCDIQQCRNGVTTLEWDDGHGHARENIIAFAEQGERP